MGGGGVLPMLPPFIFYRNIIYSKSNILGRIKIGINLVKTMAEL